MLYASCKAGAHGRPRAATYCSELLRLNTRFESAMSFPPLGIRTIQARFRQGARDDSSAAVLRMAFASTSFLSPSGGFVDRPKIKCYLREEPSRSRIRA